MYIEHYKSWLLLFLSLGISSVAAQFTAQNGTLHSGNLPDSSSSDEWTLATTAEADLLVSIGTEFSPSLQIFDSSGDLLAQRLGNGGDTIAELYISSVPSDTYRIRVGSRFGQSGAYVLNAVSLSGSTFVAAGDEGGLVTGVEAREASLPPGDLDVWTVLADEGNTIISRLGTEFSPAIRIFDPDGKIVASNFGNGGDRTADLIVRATTSGVHSVVISGRFSQEGDYSLTLASIPKSFSVPTGDEGGLLPVAIKIDGDIPLGDLDFWKLFAERGDRILIRGETDDAAISMRLYDSTGDLIAFLNGNGGDRDRTLVHDAPRTEELFLSVGTRFIGSATPYALTLDIQHPELAITEINDSGADLDWSNFQGLVLEGSDNLVKWNIVTGEVQPDGETLSGSYEPSQNKAFFRFRWE